MTHFRQRALAEGNFEGALLWKLFLVATVPIHSRRRRFLPPMPAARNLLLTVALSAVLSLSSAAQVKGERKVIEKVAPVYPQLAKQLNITGTVKLEVVVRANGTVKSTRVVGGSPVLIPSATEAVRKWKFEPASEETTGTVQLSFDQR